MSDELSGVGRGLQRLTVGNFVQNVLQRIGLLFLSLAISLMPMAGAAMQHFSVSIASGHDADPSHHCPPAGHGEESPTGIPSEPGCDDGCPGCAYCGYGCGQVQGVFPLPLAVFALPGHGGFPRVAMDGTPFSPSLEDRPPLSAS